MKQVKKLLVILPLVALFVLGSLPVLAAAKYTYQYNGADITDTIPSKEGEKFAEDNLKVLVDGNTFDPTKDGTIATDVTPKLEDEKKPLEQTVTVTITPQAGDKVEKKFKFNYQPKAEENNGGKGEKATDQQVTIEYYNLKYDGSLEPSGEDSRGYTLPAWLFEKLTGTNQYSRTVELADRIRKFVMKNLQDGYGEVGTSFADAAERFLNPEDKKNDVVIKLYRDRLDYARKVVAYDIHNGEYVFDRLYKVEMKSGMGSWKDISEAFYNNTLSLRGNYLYVGFATRHLEPVLLFRAAYLERFAREDYVDVLDDYSADLVVFVVPKQIPVTVEHIFPTGTRSPLRETVLVDYEKWASLQNSWTFMDLPGIFQTRIQKVNEMGFAFNHVEYYNGQRPITGLLQGYDWFSYKLVKEGDDSCVARVFYDKAVAAAKEVPTEKKVDAATAPQAQIKAPAAQAQAQAPVTAANTTTTTAPANTLPVTGASDSIFLFLSSAALMAVGILFFKKH